MKSYKKRGSKVRSRRKTRYSRKSKRSGGLRFFSRSAKVGIAPIEPVPVRPLTGRALSLKRRSERKKKRGRKSRKVAPAPLSPSDINLGVDRI